MACTNPALSSKLYAWQLIRREIRFASPRAHINIPHYIPRRRRLRSRALSKPARPACSFEARLSCAPVFTARPEPLSPPNNPRRASQISPRLACLGRRPEGRTFLSVRHCTHLRRLRARLKAGGRASHPRDCNSPPYTRPRLVCGRSIFSSDARALVYISTKAKFTEAFSSEHAVIKGLALKWNQSDCADSDEGKALFELARLSLEAPVMIVDEDFDHGY